MAGETVYQPRLTPINMKKNRMNRPVICALRTFLVPAGLLLIAADSGAQDSEGQPATSFAKFEGIDAAR